MRRLGYAIRIYSKLQLVHLRAHLEYEADFWLGIVGLALTHGAGFAFIWTVFHQVPVVASWTFWEVAFVYALWLIPRSLVTILCDGPWLLGQLVNQGELDILLVRPISPALQVMTQLASISGFGSLLLGAFIFLRSVQALQPAWSLWHLGFLAVTLLSATVLVAAIIFAANCIAFWSTSGNNAFPVLVQQTLEFVKFPLQLYGQVLQFVLTWMVPFAFLSYYPGLVLLDKADRLRWLGYGSPVAAVVMALMAGVIWRRGLRNYQSAGH